MTKENVTSSGAQGSTSVNVLLEAEHNGMMPSQDISEGGGSTPLILAHTIV